MQPKPMMKLSFRRVRAGKEARLRDWLAELSVRADEVRATFVGETVRSEQAFLVHTVDGLALVYAVEASDLECARDAFERSPHAIDAVHKRVMSECLGDRLDIPPVYSVALEEQA